MRLVFFILLPSSFLLVFSSCKRIDKKKPIKFTIQAHIPYSGEPISGVKYRIIEYRSKKFSMKLNDIEYTDFKMEGVTDAGGWARISLIPKKNLDYRYMIDFDYSNIQFPSFSGDYTLINEPHFDMMTRNNQRSYTIRALPLMQVNYKLENINCSGPSDSMRIILRNYDEEYYLNFNYETWSPYATGCYSNSHQIEQGLAGRYVYKMQVIRNGNLTETIDTILIAPGVNSNLFIEY